MTGKFRCCWILVVLLLPILVCNAHGDDFTVINRDDSGNGSLRWAIEQANTNSGADNIDFDIPSIVCGGSHCVITPTSSLPILTDDGTTIDGYSQPGAFPAGEFSPAVLKIVLSGTSAGFVNGLNIASSNNLVKGLNINQFDGSGIAIGNAATGNRIEGNYIGTDIYGTADLGNGFNGIFIGLGASSNTIGCVSSCGGEPSKRNVISGNGWSGIEIHGAGTEQNVIGHNYLGINAAGSSALGNTMHGVRIYGGAKYNEIKEHPAIGGNVLDGVRISGSETTGNQVTGGHIGVYLKNVEVPPDSFEVIAIAAANGANGITVNIGARENMIFGCLIGNNGGHGVEINGAGTNENALYSNFIGFIPDIDTLPAQNAGNEGHGVVINNGASGNYVGAFMEGSPCAGNYISGNSRYGVLIDGPTTTDNTVVANFIGTDFSGMAALGNGGNGIGIANGSYENIIGGTNPDFALGNIVSGNSGDGISLFDADANYIFGNCIGINKDGSATIPNGGNGIVLSSGSSGNIIDSGNVIVGSAAHGISIIEGSSQTRITGNYIGTNGSGLVLGNSGAGVSIMAGAGGGSITDTNISMNTIANNTGGVIIDNDLATGNQIRENFIYDNTGPGIDLKNGANNGIDAPAITLNTLDPPSVSGSACANCRVEVFSSSSNDAEGEVYLGWAFADGSGNFTVSVASLPYRYLTATATDSSFNSSEFSTVFYARMPFSWPMFMPAITGSGVE